MTDRLYKDYETKSEVDISEVGLANYIEHPTTEVLMMSYALNDEPVRLWEPGDHLPPEIKDAMRDPHVIKCAWNAAFERNVQKQKMKIDTNYRAWIDIQVKARYMSMPGSLETVGEIVGLPEHLRKLEDAYQQYIKAFTMPVSAAVEETLFGRKPATFRDKHTDPERWQKFREYCMSDTEAERAIDRKLDKFPLPPEEWEMWYLDQKINEFGMPVWMDLVHGAQTVARHTKNLLRDRQAKLTGLENPNSRDQLLGWLQDRGYTFGSLGKAFVARALTECKLTDEAREALETRKQLSKTSDSKFDAICSAVSPDGRLRHQFTFMGAGRTARWTGKDVQMQNLARPVKEVAKKLDKAVELLVGADYLGITQEFKCSPMEVVVSCIRPCFRAPEGKKFRVCDLSAIENRGLGWVARCKKILQVFEDGLDPYLHFATFMYHKEYAELAKAYEAGEGWAKEMRQNAKPPVLGAGYRLGGGDERENKDGDIVRTGLWGYAQAMGIEMPQEEAHRAVKVFRSEYPEVEQLWYDLENAALKTMRTGQPQQVGPVVMFAYGKRLFRIQLPSGRFLNYIKPEIVKLEFFGKTKDTLTYAGINQETKQWDRTTTHGGKLTENIVQAISRDILREGLLNADKAGFEICGHVHDEIITLGEEDSLLGIDELRACMIKRPAWAQDFPLDAAGYEDSVYRKD